MIKTLRKAAGLTQKQLSDLTGLHTTQIQKLESGESQLANLRAKNFIALADALGVDPHELLNDKKTEA